jgi:hypothetical protein
MQRRAMLGDVLIMSGQGVALVALAIASIRQGLPVLLVLEVIGGVLLARGWTLTIRRHNSGTRQDAPPRS